MQFKKAKIAPTFAVLVMCITVLLMVLTPNLFQGGSRPLGNTLIRLLGSLLFSLITFVVIKFSAKKVKKLIKK
jgi:type IV secretory pathway VirB2 component (pilin)